MSRPVRSWLYVPADQPELFEKALASGADAIVLDLEDAVAPSRKAAARAHAAALVDEPRDRPVVVRVNALPSGGGEDVQAVAGPGLWAVSVPKIETEEEVARVGGILESTGCSARVVPLIETGLGVERAYALATAHPRVGGLSVGDFDLATSVGSAQALEWCHGRVLVAAAASGLPRPPQSAYLSVHDLEGLRIDCERGRAFGFFGRSAVHPKQIPIINAAYTPTDHEVIRAQALLDSVARAHAGGAGAWLDEEGRLVDAAMIARARETVTLAGSVK